MKRWSVLLALLLVACLLSGCAALSQRLGVVKKGEVQAAPKGWTSYEVKEGDTLWKIAADVYGDGRMWEQIAKENSIGDAKDLKVGQKLRVPKR